MNRREFIIGLLGVAIPPTIAAKNGMWVKGWHKAGDGGGGMYHRHPAQDKNIHNGGTIIDPDISWT